MMKMETKVKNKYCSKYLSRENAEVYGQELEKISKENEGITPDIVVETATDEKNPLHGYFEWDDGIAGHSWRKQQARVLINCIVIEHPDIETKIAKYENIKIETGERVYKDIVEIMTDEDYRNQVLDKAMKSINYWREQYSGFTALLPIIEAIDKVNKELKSDA
jgi:hypothetical protein